MFLTRRPALESSFEEIGDKGDPVLEILAGVFCDGIVSKYHLSRWKASFWGRPLPYGNCGFWCTKKVKLRDF